MNLNQLARFQQLYKNHFLWSTGREWKYPQLKDIDFFHQWNRTGPIPTFAQWPFFIILQRIELPINLLKTALFDQCDRTGLFHQLWIKRHFYQLQGICVWNSWRKSMRFNNGRNKIVSKTWNRLFSFKCTEFHQLKLTKMTFSWLQRKKKKKNNSKNWWHRFSSIHWIDLYCLQQF